MWGQHVQIKDSKPVVWISAHPGVFILDGLMWSGNKLCPNRCIGLAQIYTPGCTWRSVQVCAASHLSLIWTGFLHETHLHSAQLKIAFHTGEWVFKPLWMRPKSAKCIPGACKEKVWKDLGLILHYSSSEKLVMRLWCLSLTVPQTQHTYGKMRIHATRYVLWIGAFLLFKLKTGMAWVGMSIPCLYALERDPCFKCKAMVFLRRFSMPPAELVLKLFN